ncbi:hypothetical protein [Aeromicrobium sp. UC242_57]|uniref:hypothetical protein n=1 Tax=Aeromicrobium sp. UC242_57 TaxID=3374624 RepID=UPI0037A022E8
MATEPVTVAHRYLNRTIVKEKSGTATSSRKKGKGCYFDTYRKWLEMACEDGTSAKATWTFKLPANAKQVRGDLYGEQGYSRAGKTSLTGKRIGKKKYRITLKITKWRQEFVEVAQVTYKTRVKS